MEKENRLFNAELTLDINEEDGEILLRVENMWPVYSYDGSYYDACVAYYSFYIFPEVVRTENFIYDSEREQYQPLKKKICNTGNDPLPNHTVRKYPTNITRTYEINKSELYSYPYDNITHNHRIKFFDDHMKEISVSKFIVIKSHGRRLSNIPQEDKDGYTLVRLSRSKILLYLTPLIIFIITLFIVVIIFIEELSSFSEVTIAIVFGLWGSKQILVSPDIKGAIALDAVFVILYFLLGISVIIRIAIIPFISFKPEKKQEQKNRQEELDAVLLQKLLNS